MRSIIKVQNLSKQYFLGGPAEPYSTIRETLVNLARKPLRAFRGNGHTPELWALKDVSFEIGQGEVVGIIGRNGAGKSTLLKILSRITEPTSGKIELFGRVASLLEVGTGFHPELSGRENIYLNGSILGMSHKEIESKFDEIVAFAEVDKFIDTPVKRYSSGMYVRLAFAVAAHLEPEILVVDEVLAVGDYNFQQKCLNKMQDVSKRGRTVLFVSHNMGAISRLCERCILLDQGRLVSAGSTASIVQTYMTSGLMERAEYTQDSSTEKAVNLTRIALVDQRGEVSGDISYDGEAKFVLDYEVNQTVTGVSVGIALFTVDGTCAFVTGDFDSHPELLGQRQPGRYQTVVQIPPRWLNTGRYTVTVYIANGSTGVVYDSLEALVFNVVDTGTPGSRHGVERKGVLQPVLDWTTTLTSK
ncbi:MAG TPA: ABC transporter ATP-binding protein [Pyrinomonadaceae bacterium]